MSLDRRQFLLTTAALAAAARRGFPAEVPPDSVFPEAVRANFPTASAQTYLNSASQHPLGLHASSAIERYLAYRVNGPGDGRSDFGAEQLDGLKARYARLINATPEEIAFVQNTSDGENIVVMGMDLPQRGGNVVLDELHFTTSLYMYKALEATGLELRIVKHRDWAIDPADVARVVDAETRLVSIALVSNVNGFLHDVQAISRIAHERGAYLYADIVQAVGAVPVDVRAMGIDFASTATYKWLMGERGFGFLYVRGDLQDRVVPTTRYGHRQITNFDRVAVTWEALPGAARYETGTLPNALAACTDASLVYLDELGLERIQKNAQALTDRLQEELPAMGYASLTPRGTRTPIVAFAVPDAASLARQLREARVAVTFIEREQRMRVSVSVFNTHEDIDRLVGALPRPVRSSVQGPA